MDLQVEGRQLGKPYTAPLDQTLKPRTEEALQLGDQEAPTDGRRLDPGASFGLLGFRVEGLGLWAYAYGFRYLEGKGFS